MSLRNDFTFLYLPSAKQQAVLSELRRYEIIHCSQLAFLFMPQNISGESLVNTLRGLMWNLPSVILTEDNYLYCDEVTKNIDRAATKCIWPILQNSVFSSSDDTYDNEHLCDWDDETYFSPYGLKVKFPLEISTVFRGESPVDYICYGLDRKIYCFTSMEYFDAGKICFLQERYYARQIVRNKGGKDIIENPVMNMFVTDKSKVRKEILEMDNLEFPFGVCEIMEKKLPNDMPCIKYFWQNISVS